MTKFLTIHFIQSLPLNNANRDSVGAPKKFGSRAYLSSQCVSHVAREQLRENFGGQLSTRSKSFSLDLAEKVANITGFNESECCQLFFALTGGYLSKEKGVSKKAVTMVSLAPSEQMLIQETLQNQENAEAFREYLDQFPAYETALAEHEKKLAAIEDKGEKREFKKKAPVKPGITPELKTVSAALQKRLKLEPLGAPIDIALWGRFLASWSDKVVHGALYRSFFVATHKTQTEVDYFTAVDDLNDELDQGGSGHLGDRLQTSATYAATWTIDLDQFEKNLTHNFAKTDDRIDLKECLADILKTLILSPRGTGHLHQYNHHSLPELAVFEVSNAQPVNCQGAFEEPIKAENGSYSKPSLVRFGQWHESLHKKLVGLVNTHSFHCGDIELSTSKSCESYRTLIESVLGVL